MLHFRDGKNPGIRSGETIIREGEFGNWVFFLVSGSVNILKERKIIYTIQRRGELFGEICVIDGGPRPVTARAGSTAVVFCLDASILDHKEKAEEVKFSYIMYRLFAERLTERLRDTMEKLAALQRENCRLSVRQKNYRIIR